MLQQLWATIREHVTRPQLARFGLSLAVALLLWGWVTQLQDPVSTQRYAEIPISPPELPGTTQIVTSLPRATVTIRAATSTLDDITRSDIIVSVDTSEVEGPGSYQLPVVVSTDEDVREITISPDTVSVQVEEEVSRLFPLVVENQVLANDARRIVDITPESTEVTVTGTESAVNRINRVVLPVSIQQQTSDFVELIEPHAVDDEGQRVQEVEITPGHVRTQVELESQGKTVSVVPQVTGTPAEGYIVQQQVAVPSTVIVDGPQEVLSSLLFINTEPVDITGATESISEVVSLEDLPEGVTLLDPPENEIEVRVSIGSQSGMSNVIPDMPVEATNLRGGLTANIDPESISISVSASPSTLTSLTSDDVHATVDLSGLGPGVYTLTPEIDVPEGVSVASLEPEQLVVFVTDGSATPTSGSTPIDSPTARLAL